MGNGKKINYIPSTHPFEPDRGLGDGLVEAGLTLGLLLTGLADGLLDVALGLGLALAGLGDRPSLSDLMKPHGRISA